MSATVITIADAVVSALNAASLSQGFTATREYVLPKNLTDLGTLTVSVAPSLLAIKAFDLGPRKAFEPEIAIGIRQRTGNVKATNDALMLLGEEVASLFAFRPLDGTNARNVGVEVRPVYDPAALDTQGICSTLILLTFRLTN